MSSRSFLVPFCRRPAPGARRLQFALRLAAGFACGAIAPLASQAREAVRPPPVKVIFDTDYSTDCDDVGALAVLHALADNGEAEILATGASTRLDKAPGAIDVINTYYGRPDIPIAATKVGPIHASAFVAHLYGNFPHDTPLSAAVEDAVAAYRRILAAQPDDSVIFITVGYLTNMAGLLDSGPDRHSPLPGRDLVAAKVREWACMGGNFWISSTDNVNFTRDAASAFRAIRDFPKKLTFLPREVASVPSPLRAGEELNQTPADNPVRVAYHKYFKRSAGIDRHCADLATVLYAVRGRRDYWDLHTEGSMDIRPDGTFTWDGSGRRDHDYLVMKGGYGVYSNRAYVESVLRGLLKQAPAAATPGKPSMSMPTHNPVSQTADSAGDIRRQEAPTAEFALNERGFLRHWLVSGPRETPYAGQPAPDHVLRREAIDPATPGAPTPASPGEAGPFGAPWRFHYPGNNDFVEFSTFYRGITLVEYYAATEIVAPQDGEWPARLWTAGASDLWLNGEHLARHNVTRYRNPDCRDLTLRLRAGVNRLALRLQCTGIRDTRILFGLSLPDPRGVKARLPGAAGFATVAAWLDSVRGDRGLALVSSGPAPAGVTVALSNGTKEVWPPSATRFPFDAALPSGAKVAVDAGTALERSFEFPANRPAPKPIQGDRRAAHLEFIAKAGVGDEPAAGWNGIALPLLARRLLGRTTPVDSRDFAACIAMIDARQDCSDFVLAGLLRLERLGLATPAESAEIERAALAYRYWTDEPGNDAMCFTSENHSLLFHGCQLLAGRRYPAARFAASGRDGAEQARVALPRIRDWLARIEARGFEEFNSGTYMPITIAAMLNVADFGGDEELATRMRAQIDRIYRDLARHSFGGGVISPQGRVYGDVLFPEETGTQALLALATAAADVNLEGRRSPEQRTGGWAVFPASSTSWRPPSDLAGLIREPVSLTYRHADVQIVLEKTSDHLLTSLNVPAEPRPGEQPHNDLRPFGAGYQQHLWQATLGRDCHVFVNHPGGTFDGTKSRPGYWHGNGLLPRVRQRGRVLQAIHVIADGRWSEPPITPDVWQWGGPSTARPYDVFPVLFTHAHWPADSFDRVERRGGWIFGRKGDGLIGLWCSEPLVPHDDVLTGRELRAYGAVSAWLVVCGGIAEDGSLENFMAACEAREPALDRESFTMRVNGEPPLRWWERSEPMPGGGRLPRRED